MSTIRELRELRKWTQADLAARIDVTPSTVYNWERGRYEPRVHQLRELARLFDCTMDEITLVHEDRKIEGDS